MSKSKFAEKNSPSSATRSITRGAIAGLIGGLVGVVAMTYAERLAAARQIEAETPQQPPQFEPIRWGLAAAVGASYGALAEFYPVVTAQDGATFGMALAALPCEPALTTKPSVEPIRKAGVQSSSSHVLFGVATEMGRKLVRRWL
jgi:putative membrane protein